MYVYDHTGLLLTSKIGGYATEKEARAYMTLLGETSEVAGAELVDKYKRVLHRAVRAEYLPKKS